MSIKSFIAKITSKDYCVHWAGTGSDDDGKHTVAAPVELKCRWEDNQIEFLDKEGKLVMSKSQVLFKTGTVIDFGGILWHGRLADVVDPVIPANNVGAYEIRGISRIPDIKNHGMLITVFL